MANTFTLKSQSYDGRYLQVDCTQTIDIVTNTSTINWTLSVLGGNSNYYTTGATTLTINGTQVYYKGVTYWNSYAFPAAKGSTSGTLKIPHNNDGKKEINISLSTAIYYATVETNSKKWTLDNIPRKATIVTAPNFTDDTASFNVTYSNLASATIELCISSDSQKIDLAAYRPLLVNGTSYEFIFTDAERENLRKHSLSIGKDSFTVWFVLRTTIGTNKFYHSVTKTCTIADCAPVLNPTIYGNERTFFLTGEESTLIKSFGDTAVAVNATARKGATIKSYSITCGNAKLTAATGTIANAESNIFTFSATDSRNVTTTKEVKVKMIDYYKPTCNFKVNAPTTDGKLTFTIDGILWDGDFGDYINYAEIAYRIKENGGEWSDWEDLESIEGETEFSITYTLTGLNYRNSYTVQAITRDMLYMIESAEIVTQTIPVFDWSKTDFNFNVPVSFEGDTMADFVIEEGTDSMGSNGVWYWRKWKSGRADCYGCRNYGNMSVSTAWGNLYRSEAFNQSLPTGLFSTTPDLIDISYRGANYGGWIAKHEASSASKDNSGGFILVRPASATLSQAYISFNIIGRWK